MALIALWVSLFQSLSISNDPEVIEEGQNWMKSLYFFPKEKGCVVATSISEEGTVF